MVIACFKVIYWVQTSSSAIRSVLCVTFTIHFVCLFFMLHVEQYILPVYTSGKQINTISYKNGNPRLVFFGHSSSFGSFTSQFSMNVMQIIKREDRHEIWFKL